MHKPATDTPQDRWALLRARAASYAAVALDQVRIHLQAEQAHQRDHRHAGREKRPPVAAPMDFARDVRDGQRVEEGDAEQPRVGAPEHRAGSRQVHAAQRTNRQCATVQWNET